MRHLAYLLLGLGVILLVACNTFMPPPTAAEVAAETECLRDIAQKGVE